MGKGYLLGIDIGNTKLAFGLVGCNERRFHEKRVVPTERELGAEQAIEKVLDNTRELLATAPGEVAGIGSLRRIRWRDQADWLVITQLPWA